MDIILVVSTITNNILVFVILLGYLVLVSMDWLSFNFS